MKSESRRRYQEARRRPDNRENHVEKCSLRFAAFLQYLSSAQIRSNSRAPAARVAAAHLDSLRSGLENSQAANSPTRAFEIRGRMMCVAVNSSLGRTAKSQAADLPPIRPR